MLIEKLLHDHELEESLFASLRVITQYLTRNDIAVGYIRAYLETELDESNNYYPAIAIGADISSVEEWNDLESNIEQLIRENESEQVMIYSFVESVDA